MLYKMINFFTYRTIVCIRQNVNRTKLNKKFANKARSQHLNRPFRILNLITLWDQSHCAPPTDFLGTFCDRKTRKRTASFAIFSDFSLRQQWKGYRQLLHFCAAAPTPHQNADWLFVAMWEPKYDIFVYFGQLWLWRMWQSAKKFDMPLLTNYSELISF